ncbi:hypothetical protein H696_03202 [Fonticula alba]|uniref:Protein-tyrosine sulfotransferase n=1 Tax=Fonticula alba TaxID=691883 RepID=A0A058Z990_FONAL|nr:hypothetical protein H696_03202 [Fonticula alba]KCV70845.1 hypothetical protein H696_03202 [Fonticula alba]|eukprot:XP_009495361.1 hypothetical protein H696_03202 [Fonticula alba]
MLYIIASALAGLAVFVGVFGQSPGKKNFGSNHFPRGPNYRPHFRVLAMIYRAMYRLGLRPGAINIQHYHDLIDSAPSKHFGPQDDCHRSLRIFTRGVEANPNISAIGRIMVRSALTRCLNARFNVMKFVDEHPEIVDVKIDRPIIIVGLPRTGSTLLQGLMSRDPASRSPYFFEMIQFHNPTPPTTKEGFATDPRIKMTEDRLKTLDSLAPGSVAEMSKSHPARAFIVDEELMIMFHQLVLEFYLLAAGDEFFNTFVDCTHKEYAYIYTKRFIQMMQWSWAPDSHWVLKSPFHSLYMEDLMKQFPDARIVITHRNVHSVVPSFAKLIEVQAWQFFEDATVDRRIAGRYAVIASQKMIEGVERFRKFHTGTKPFDCRYPELVKDPVAMVKRIYDHFDMDFTPAFENALRSFINDNPQGKHGRNTYTLEDFGLSAQELDETFAEYQAQYA